jgi:hypothetical protein
MQCFKCIVFAMLLNFEGPIGLITYQPHLTISQDMYGLDIVWQGQLSLVLFIWIVPC